MSGSSRSFFLMSLVIGLAAALPAAATPVLFGVTAGFGSADGQGGPGGPRSGTGGGNSSFFLSVDPTSGAVINIRDLGVGGNVSAIAADASGNIFSSRGGETVQGRTTLVSRSRSFFGFTPLPEGAAPVFLPSVGEDGVFNFDIAVSASMTEVSFAGSGRFTGSMTPLTQLVETTPEPGSLALMALGLLGLVLVLKIQRRRKSSNKE